MRHGGAKLAKTVSSGFGKSKTNEENNRPLTNGHGDVMSKDEFRDIYGMKDSIFEFFKRCGIILNCDTFYAWNSVKNLEVYKDYGAEIEKSENPESLIQALFLTTYKNKFTFHPVGHGLFYSGSLDSQINFVYDCGSSRSTDMKNITANYKPKDKDVDFLIVSHFDKDHVCGIYDLSEELKKQGKKIKKMYLPYLYDSKKIFLPKSSADDKLIFKLAIANALSEVSGQNAEYLSSAFRWWADLLDGNTENITEVAFVGGKELSNNNENNENTENMPEIIIVGKKISNDGGNVELTIVYGEKEHLPSGNIKAYWCFKMFNRMKKNKKDPVDISKINREVEELLTSNGNKKIEEYLSGKDAYKELGKIYKDNCSEINNSSTILIHYPMYSGTFYEHGIGSMHNLFRHFNCKQSLHHVCNSDDYITTTILTGDVEFDDDTLSMMKTIIFSKPELKNGVKVFQVPHHGALDNWNSIDSKKIALKFEFDIYVVSCECQDKKHPDPKLLFELVSAGKYIRSATQFGKYSYVIEL